ALAPRPTTLWRSPATGRAPPQSPPAAAPLSRSRVPGAFRPATPRTGLTTTGGALPTLRHASAPHLLAAGVPPRLMQRYLGHAQLATPLLPLHPPPTGQAETSELPHTLIHG